MRSVINSKFTMCSPDSGVFEPELGEGLHGGDEAGLLLQIPGMFDGQPRCHPIYTLLYIPSD